MEIVFYHKKSEKPETDDFSLLSNIRWLTVDDYELFCCHLRLCGQNMIRPEVWKDVYSAGTMYCGFFIGDKMVSRACVEKVSSNAWEVADVRTAKGFRGNGYACLVSRFVLCYILSQGKSATIRTEEENTDMKRIISKLGFSLL